MVTATGDLSCVVDGCRAKLSRWRGFFSYSENDVVQEHNCILLMFQIPRMSLCYKSQDNFFAQIDTVLHLKHLKRLYYI